MFDLDSFIDQHVSAWGNVLPVNLKVKGGLALGLHNIEHLGRSRTR